MQSWKRVLVSKLILKEKVEIKENLTWKNCERLKDMQRNKGDCFKQYWIRRNSYSDLCGWNIRFWLRQTNASYKRSMEVWMLIYLLQVPAYSKSELKIKVKQL